MMRKIFFKFNKIINKMQNKKLFLKKITLLMMWKINKTIIVIIIWVKKMQYWIRLKKINKIQNQWSVCTKFKIKKICNQKI